MNQKDLRKLTGIQSEIQIPIHDNSQDRIEVRTQPQVFTHVISKGRDGNFIDWKSLGNSNERGVFLTKFEEQKKVLSSTKKPSKFKYFSPEISDG